MAHKTIVDGTAYAITGGKCMVDGTVYEIKNGKTLIDGTGYSIKFKAATAQLTLDFDNRAEPTGSVTDIIPDDSPSDTTGQKASTYSIFEVNGVTYNILSEDVVLEVDLGTKIYVTLQDELDGCTTTLLLNDVQLYSGNPKSNTDPEHDNRQHFTFEVRGNSTIYYETYNTVTSEGKKGNPDFVIHINGEVINVTPANGEAST